MSRRQSPRRLLFILPMLVGLITSGCGEKDTGPPKLPLELDPIELLKVLDTEGQKHDPRKFVEVELGVFKVTRPAAEETKFVTLRFKAFGVLPEDKQEKFAEKLAEHEKRMRDTVMSVVQKVNFDLLSDPTLEAVKAELVEAINRTTQCDYLRDVAFSEFGIDRR